MNMKEFHEQLNHIHKEYDETILKKLSVEQELMKVKTELSVKIIELNAKAKELRLEKTKLVTKYHSEKRSPEEVQRLRKQFMNKRDSLMKDKERKCHYCPETENLTAHHDVALVDGGENTKENLVWACRPCHDREEGRSGGMKNGRQQNQ